MRDDDQIASILIWVAMYLLGNVLSTNRAQLIATLTFFELHALIVALIRIFS